MSNLERTFDTWMRRLAPDLPAPVAEHQFAKPRRWRFGRRNAGIGEMCSDE